MARTKLKADDSLTTSVYVCSDEGLLDTNTIIYGRCKSNKSNKSESAINQTGNIAKRKINEVKNNELMNVVQSQ